ncbi:plasmid stability protein StbD, antitoxin of toxin-antitoxin stability system [Stutzerimonas stutzeri]|nr:plasmid stability protein StbD, antitoxin of toxin-antitoxin stability system [Stutzerimonas stutzeri]
MRIIREGAGETVLIIHRNEPAFYAVPPTLYKAMLEVIDDSYLAEGEGARSDESTVKLDIDSRIVRGR